VPSSQTNLLEAPPGSSIPGEYREVGEPAGGRGRLYVAALAGKAKTQRYAQTRPGRVMLLRLRAGHAKGSRTHYLAGSGTHCGNWQGLSLVKTKAGRLAGLAAAEAVRWRYPAQRSMFRAGVRGWQCGPRWRARAAVRLALVASWRKGAAADGLIVPQSQRTSTDLYGHPTPVYRSTAAKGEGVKNKSLPSSSTLPDLR
jgi:hypothetical protein